MDRDMDLLREMLGSYIEAEDSNCYAHNELPLVPDVDRDIILAHRQLLFDAGYLVPFTDTYGQCTRPGNGFKYSVSNLGYDFHELTQDTTVWEKTKELAGKAGSSTLEVMFEIAKALVKDKLETMLTGGKAQ